MAGRALTVAFLDVGQGDATIILPPEGEGGAIVFDCGDGWVVRQQLDVWGIAHLAAVVASHLDLDHVGGLGDLLGAYGGRIDEVYWSAERDLTDAHDSAQRAKELTDTLIAGETQGRWAIRSVERQLSPLLSGRDWSVHLVAPRGGKRAQVARTGTWDRANVYSAVLRVTMAGVSVTVGGDAPLVTWAELPDHELAAAVFRVPHHGGALDDGGVPDGWSAQRLYDKVAPRTAAVSVGTRNTHNHPDADPWIAPLVARPGCRLLCTQVTPRCHPAFGDTTAVEGHRRAAGREWIAAERNGTSHFAEPPWRHLDRAGSGRLAARLEVPCAGTISVRIDEHGEVMVDPAPENTSLSARIALWDRPLCRR